MAGVKIEVKDSEIRNALNKVSQKTEHLEPLLFQIGTIIEESTKDRFETETDPAGQKWKPSISALNGTSRKTLTKDGYLSDGIHFKVSKDKVEVGSNAIYAAIHQLGGTIKPKNKQNLAFKIGKKVILASKVEMPARPFLGISEKDKDVIGRAIKDYMVEVF